MGYLDVNGIKQTEYTAPGVGGVVTQYADPANNGIFVILNRLSGGASSSFNFVTRDTLTAGLRSFRIFNTDVNFNSRTLSSCPTIDAIVTVNNTQTTNIATNTTNIATNTTNIATNTSDIATNTVNIATNTANIATNTANIASIVTVNNTQTANIASVVSVNNTQNSNIANNTKVTSAFYRFQSNSTDMRFNGISNFDANGAEIEGVSRLVLDPASGGSGQGMIHNVTTQDLRIHANNFHAGGSGIVFRTMQNLTTTSKDARLSFNDFQLNGRTISGCTNLDSITSEVAVLTEGIQNYNSKILEWDDFVAPINMTAGQTARSKLAWKNHSNSGNVNTKAYTVDSVESHPGVIEMIVSNTPTFANYSVHLGLENMYCWGDIQKIELIFKVPSGQWSNNFKIGFGVSDTRTFTNSAMIYSTNNANFQVSVNNGASLYTAPNYNFRAGNWTMLDITNTGGGNCTFRLSQPQDQLATTNTYAYTGGALSSSALISPWAYIQEVSGNLASKVMWLDYVSIRTISNRNN